MAFGIFGKKETADLIIINADIYTQDPDFPRARAVACKNGIIIAVGDKEDLLDMQTSDTFILDLQGKYVTPGLIEVNGSPVMNAFFECCFFLDPQMNEDEIKETLASRFSLWSEKISSNAENADAGFTNSGLTGSDSADSGLADLEEEASDVFFAYGYDPNILSGKKTEEAARMLDEITGDHAAVILAENSAGIWINSSALDLVRNAAREDEVEVLTIPYIITVLDPFDNDALKYAVNQQTFSWCQRGITTVFNSGSPEVFSEAYQSILISMLQEGFLRQRFFDSLSVFTNTNTRYLLSRLMHGKTLCTELDGFINFNTLKLNSENDNSKINDDYLEKVFAEISTRGFDMIVEDHNKKYRYLGPEEDPDIFCEENTSSDMDSYIRYRTVDAAYQIGMSEILGSVEVGKKADFTVFEEDPLQKENLPEAFMTILNGDIVYDSEEDDINEWYELMTSQQF